MTAWLRTVPARISRFLLSFEQGRAPFGRYLVSFAAIVTIRQLLETFSTGSVILLPRFLHYAAWYAATASCLIWLVRLLVGGSVNAVARSVLASFALILVAPVVDLIATGGAAVPMRYLQGNLRDLAVSFATLLGGRGPARATTGLRVEAGIILAVACAYLAAKGRAALGAIGGTLAVYLVLFLFTLVPQWTALFFRGVEAVTGTMAAPGEQATSWLLFLVAVLFTLLSLRRASPGYFRAIVRDIRPLRLLHYVVVFVLGYVLFRQSSRQFMALDHQTLYFVGVPLSLAGAAVFSIVSNNLEDAAIDRISNPGRPHVRGDIPEPTYRSIGYAALAFALATAAAVGYYCLLLVGIIAGCYFLYSAAPFRLKRIPLLSKLVIGLNSLAAAMIGFTAFGGDPLRFPRPFIFFFLVPFALAANAIDLKDEAGDRAEGVRTLPVLLGGRLAAAFVAVAIAGCYLTIYLALGRRDLAAPVTGLCLLHVVTVLVPRIWREWVVTADLVALTTLVVVLAGPWW